MMKNSFFSSYKVFACNSHPELAEEAVSLARQEGVRDLFTFALPDYHEEDCGARSHPNAEWNRRAGLLLADFLRNEVLRQTEI